MQEVEFRYSKIQKPETEPQLAAHVTTRLLEIVPLPQPYALETALQAGQSEAALVLIRAGILDGLDQQRINKLFDSTFFRSNRVNAIPSPTPKLAQEFLQYADINAWQGFHEKYDIPPSSEKDYSVFVRACAMGADAEVVKVLVKAGALYDTRHNYPMIAALESGKDNPDLIVYLLELGFSPIQKADGKTPMEAAQSPYTFGKHLSAPLLVKAGAPVPPWSESTRSRANEFVIKTGFYDEQGNPIIQSGPIAQKDKDYLAASEKAFRQKSLDNPEEALYNYDFYKKATPELVKEVISNRSFKSVRSSKKTYRKMQGYGPGAMIGNAITFFWRHLHSD